MTREETEAAIMEHLKQIRELAVAYAPENDHISLCIIGDHLSVMNYSKTTEGNLDAWVNLNDGEGMYSCRFYEGKRNA